MFRKILTLFLSVTILSTIEFAIFHNFSNKKVEGVQDINSKIISSPKESEPTNPMEPPPTNTTTNPVKNNPVSKNENQNNEPDTTINTPDTPPTPTPAPAPQLDQLSGEKLRQKAVRLLEAGEDINKFMKKSDAATRVFAIPYLDSADAKINESISYNSQIKTNGSIAQDALTNCQQADKHFQNLVIAERGWAYYNLVVNLSMAEGAIQVAASESTKAYNVLDVCIADLKTLGFD